MPSYRVCRTRSTPHCARCWRDSITQPALPLTLLVLVFAFLLVQDRIDRRDPKLAAAPLEPEPDLEFGPALEPFPAAGRAVREGTS